MDKPNYQVSSIDLSEADERALKVFLRFVGNTEAARWEWSTRDACDLLLMGGGARPPGHFENSPRLVVARIEDGGGAEPAAFERVLRRPLQMDDFSDLLRRVELGLKEDAVKIEEAAPEYSGEPAEETAPILSPAPAEEPAPASAQAPIPAPLPAPIPAPVPAPVAAPAAAAAPVIQSPPALQRPERTGRYRLARWPKAEFLRGRARATRFLSFLASGPLTVEQLCTLSGADRPTCTALLDALDSAGYLETRPAQAAAAAQAAGMASVAAMGPASTRATSSAQDAPLARSVNVRPGTGSNAPASRRPAVAVAPPDFGIFGRLRRHLGLG